MNDATRLYFAPLSEIQRVRKIDFDEIQFRNVQQRCRILADVCRLNTLYMIMKAGSGHIGSSFSSMDLMVWLWSEVLENPNEEDITSLSPSDTFFSSKGHDVPGLYAVMLACEKLSFEMIHRLRRLGGLPGHPDVRTSHIAVNSGSLGQGISKARGIALANRLNGRQGKIIVLTGDGELQEGQIWEALQPTANGEFSEITVIIDRNRIQSDTWVKEVSALGDLEAKFGAFGWAVTTCDGHDFRDIARGLEQVECASAGTKPRALIADTIKGKGVSFMQRHDNDFYEFHSGAPSVMDYTRAVQELTARIDEALDAAREDVLKLETCELPKRTAPERPQQLMKAYSGALAAVGGRNQNVVVLDADLVKDCGLSTFRDRFPERFVECGIAEQDMVSMAGGLALRGKLPIVHSFECFLSTRANEQIYTNATEGKKIIYVGSLAGLLPSGPGHSHQSVRGISTLGSIPGLTLIEPYNEYEVCCALSWAVNENLGSTYIRLISIPCEASCVPPKRYTLEMGKGIVFREGKDVAIIAYGPVMLEEALQAAEGLNRIHSISVRVVNLPWLNRISTSWLSRIVKGVRLIITIDDHYTALGQGAVVATKLSSVKGVPPHLIWGVAETPECGENREVLCYHKLDRKSIAKRVQHQLQFL